MAPGWALLVAVATVSLAVALTPEPWRGADLPHLWRQLQAQVPAYIFEAATYEWWKGQREHAVAELPHGVGVPGTSEEPRDLRIRPQGHDRFDVSSLKRAQQ